MALIAINAVPARAEVKVAKEQGGAFTIKTGIYAAAFDARGNLLHVTVKGAVAFSHTFGNPGEPPPNAPSMNVINNTVAVRDRDGCSVPGVYNTIHWTSLAGWTYSGNGFICASPPRMSSRRNKRYQDVSWPVPTPMAVWPLNSQA